MNQSKHLFNFQSSAESLIQDLDNFRNPSVILNSKLPSSFSMSELVGDERQKRMSSAVRFLSNSQVRESSLSRRVLFLKSKGLSLEEICQAFKAVGEEQSIQMIQSILQNPNTHISSSSTEKSNSNVMDSSSSGKNSAKLQENLMGYQKNFTYNVGAPSLSNDHPNHQRSRSISSSNSSWKDLLLCLLGTIITGFLGYKVFERFFPYELAWRRRASHQSSGQRRRHHQIPPRESDSSMTRKLCNKPLPELDGAQSPNFPKDSRNSKDPGSDSSNPQESLESLKKTIEDLRIQSEKLEVECTDLKESLDFEKREKAKIALTTGRLQGQLMNLDHTNESLRSEARKLREEIEALHLNSQEFEKEEELTDNVPHAESYEVTSLFSSEEEPRTGLSESEANMHK